MSSGQKHPTPLRYSDAGVDIEEGEALIPRRSVLAEA